MNFFCRPRVFLDTSRGSFPCLCVSDCVSPCLCTWSMWEPTPYVLQMSSCLIINPAFHAYVNFIITDTCIHSKGCTRINTHTHTFSFQTATVEEQLHQRQLSLISRYLRHLSLLLTRSRLSVTSHIFFFFCSFPCAFFSLCFLSSLFLTFLPSVCSTYLPGISPPKRSDVFCTFSCPISGEFTFFETPHQRIHITGCPPT